MDGIIDIWCKNDAQKRVDRNLNNKYISYNVLVTFRRKKGKKVQWTNQNMKGKLHLSFSWQS